MSMTISTNPMTAIGQVMSVVARVTGWALVLLIAAKVAVMWGARLPLAPAIDHTTLLYVAGAWWLAPK